jgi:sugar O-acyltransferase (sialic acid O-acetyltransferase NeuD family)
MSGKRFLVWGAGGHGLVVADAIIAVGGDLVGYIDADPAKLGRRVGPRDTRVLVSEEAFVLEMSKELRRHGADCLALGIGQNVARARALHRIASLDDAPPIVHPAGVLSATARVGQATLIGPLAVVNAAAAIGAGVIVNTGAIVEHECVVADAVHLSPGSVLCGGVRVGARAWIGAGAVVVPGIDVGDDAVVGAGAIVIRHVAAGSTVAGNPARPVRPS